MKQKPIWTIDFWIDNKYAYFGTFELFNDHFPTTSFLKKFQNLPKEQEICYLQVDFYLFKLKVPYTSCLVSIC